MGQADKRVTFRYIAGGFYIVDVGHTRPDDLLGASCGDCLGVIVGALGADGSGGVVKHIVHDPWGAVENDVVIVAA